MRQAMRRSSVRFASSCDTVYRNDEDAATGEAGRKALQRNGRHTTRTWEYWLLRVRRAWLPQG